MFKSRSNNKQHKEGILPHHEYVPVTTSIIPPPPLDNERQLAPTIAANDADIPQHETSTANPDPDVPILIGIEDTNIPLEPLGHLSLKRR